MWLTLCCNTVVNDFVSIAFKDLYCFHLGGNVEFLVYKFILSYVSNLQFIIVTDCKCKCVAAACRVEMQIIKNGIPKRQLVEQNIFLEFLHTF